MKIIYEKPLVSQILDAVMAARTAGKKIKEIEVSEAEMQRMVAETVWLSGITPRELYGVPVKIVSAPGEITPCDKFGNLFGNRLWNERSQQWNYR